MANGNGLSFTLTLPGVDDVAVVDFTHREALSAPFELTLNFASRNGQLNAAELLDRDATLTVWHSGEALRQVNGIVSEFSQGDRGHRRTFYSLVLRPALWRLSLRHNSRIFQKVTPITIITTLCQERGISDITFDVTREPVEREYCVQYRETDLAFIERLAAEEGLFYYHTFEAGSHRLVFSDDPKLLSSLGERTYHSRAGGTPPTRHVRQLRQTARVASSSATLKDYTFKNPAYAGCLWQTVYPHALRIPAPRGNHGARRERPTRACPRRTLYPHRPRRRRPQPRLATDRGHPLRRTAPGAGRRQHFQQRYGRDDPLPQYLGAGAR